MADDIDKKVQEALADLTAARRAFLDAVGISTTDSPPAPSSEKDITRLEKLLGKQIPPSYRSFLLLQDGFPEFDGETNILGVDEMMSLVGVGAAELLDDIAKKSGEDFIRQCIVFGCSDQSTSTFLFDTERQSDDGEWVVIEYDEEEGIDSVHESFLLFLIVSAVEAREAEQEAREGQDLLDDDF